jgi:hypothetical protein
MIFRVGTCQTTKTPMTTVPVYTVQGGKKR